MKQLCGMVCGDTRECVFFTSTTPLYSIQCTVVDMLASLAEIWYFFVHNGAITNLTPIHLQGKTSSNQKSVKTVTVVIKGNVSKTSWP